MTATARADAPTIAERGGASPHRVGLREEVFARFDVAYEKTWPAEMGQFWAERYPPGAAPYANLVHARNRRVCALCSGGEALLDVGSGYGDLLYLLREKYRTLRGVDPSARSCAMAAYNLESRGIDNDYLVTRGVAEDLEFAAGMFDTVICLDTYEHVEPANRARALSEMLRVLRPGGGLILVTPCRRRLKALAAIDGLLTVRGQIRWWRKRGWAARVFGLPKKDYCEAFCTKRELLADVRRAGLRVSRFERCSFYPAPERGGFFYPWLEKLPGDHPRVRWAMRAINFFERLGVFNQKMLVVGVKPEGT
jgi:SAM-dependent methyltransferase